MTYLVSYTIQHNNYGKAISTYNVQNKNISLGGEEWRSIFSLAFKYIPVYLVMHD